MLTVSPLRLSLLAAGVAVAVLTSCAWTAWACPFCSAVSLTFSEEISNAQVAVIAKLIEAAPRPSAESNSIDVTKAKFEVVKVLKGEKELAGNRRIETVYFGDSAVGATFLIMGIDAPVINWGTPIAISQRGQEYVLKTIDLPKDGPDRLTFFQDYLEDKDEMLARDAYDEFAKMPYAGVLVLKDRMKHDKLVEWVTSQQIPVSRRRLYLTMLGVCGTPADIPLMEEMIQSKDRQTKGALDALVAAYLTLKGPEGMPLVEELFLKNKDAEYTDTYATIMALRFHGTEEKIIPRDRLLVGIRMMLERPQLADLVIPDLARWEDWSVMDRLVELFKNADEDSNWVRVPVINYLRACPLPAAKERIDELAKLDPETVKRASTLFFPLGAASGTTTAAADAKNVDAKPAENKPSGEPAAAAGVKTTGEKASDAKPAAGTSDAANSSGVAVPAEKPAPVDAAATRPGDKSETPSGLAQPLAKDAFAEPVPPPATLPIYGGLAAAAVLMACAFWAILKGGQHATP